MKTNSRNKKFICGMFKRVVIIVVLFYGAYLGGQVRHFVENVDYYINKGV